MSRSFRVVVPLLLAVALSIAGCGKPEDKVVGSYTGKMQLSQQALSMIGKLPKATQDQLQSASAKLTLNKDKTAVLTSSGQNMSLNGTWSLDNKEVVCQFGATPGQNAQPMKLNASDDFKSLTLDTSANPTAAQYGTMVFTKN